MRRRQHDADNGVELSDVASGRLTTTLSYAAPGGGLLAVTTSGGEYCDLGSTSSHQRTIISEQSSTNNRQRTVINEQSLAATNMEEMDNFQDEDNEQLQTSDAVRITIHC